MSKIRRKPNVRKLLEEKATAMAKQAGGKPGRAAPVAPDGIIARLWELACLSPEDTKSNITGQVKAATELAEIFRMKVKLSADLTGKFKGKTKEELIYYAIHGTWPERPVAADGVAGGALLGAAGGGGSKPV